MKYFFVIVILFCSISLLFADSRVMLTSKTLDEANTGAWPCFGQNQYRTAQSSYDGPDVNIQKAWTFEVGYPIYGGVAINHDGRIFFGSDDNWFYCINSTGGLVWKEITYGDIRTTPCVDGDGQIYFGSNDGYFYCYFYDGNMKWSYRFSSTMTGAPIVDDYGNVYFGANNGYIYCVNSIGGLKWSANVDNASVFAPTLDRSGGIFVASRNHLTMLEKSGSVRWYYDTSSIYYPASVDASGNLYFTGESMVVYCHDAENQTIYWSYRLSGESQCVPSIDQNGNINVGCDDYKIHSIKPDGTRNWLFTANDVIRKQALVDVSGDVIFVSEDGWLHCLHRDGALEWKYNLASAVSGEMALAANGQIIVPLTNGNVVAITGTTGFKDQKTAKRIPQKSSLDILCNPVKDILKFKCTLENDSNVKIYDVNGRLIKDFGKVKSGSHTYSWQIPADINNGIYFINISNYGELIKSKFLILK